MRTLIFSLVFFLSAPCLADIYKTTDENGNVIYTDSPKSDNAEKIQLKEINTIPQAPRAPYNSPKIEPEVINYELTIVSPKNEAMIPLGQRDLAIAIRLNKPLAKGHLIEYFLDGELLEETEATSVIAREVPRGTHQVTVEVMDQNGQSLGTATPVTVNLMRPVIKKPASNKTK